MLTPARLCNSIAPSEFLEAARAPRGAALVREHLLTAIHVGKLRPGDRVPSVRQLAKTSGVNHKTVHRTYTALAREGVLVVRPGSGTFVRHRGRSRVWPTPQDLLASLDALRSEADRLGLTPRALSDVFSLCSSDGLRGTGVALVECNWEQIAMIGRDVQFGLRVRAHPVRLDVLAKDPASALAGFDRILTTDCHYNEVAELTGSLGTTVHTIMLSEAFPRKILEYARIGEVVMVLRDKRFGRSFARLLELLCRDPRVVRRVRYVGEAEAREVLSSVARGTHVYISPLVRPAVSQDIPGSAKLIRDCWHVDSRALEGLRAELGMELVSRRCAQSAGT